MSGVEGVDKGVPGRGLEKAQTDPLPDSPLSPEWPLMEENAVVALAMVKPEDDLCQIVQNSPRRNKMQIGCGVYPCIVCVLRDLFFG